ncbi:MAG: AsnC family transcriptional regulator [Chloroflexi bacterium]|nr:AsnC family transcriptional regulator [Chloroflexota bacterium]
MVIQDTANLDVIDKKIIQILQDDFPMVEHPWKEVGNKLNLTEDHVINRLKRLNQQGVTRKIGAIIDTSKVGLNAATLVAFKVPPAKVEEVSNVINQYAGVSHNYQRDHEYNVWFTLKAPGDQELNATLCEITQKTAAASQDILNLPTKQCFKIRVRFQIT